MFRKNTRMILTIQKSFMAARALPFAQYQSRIFSTREKFMKLDSHGEMQQALMERQRRFDAAPTNMEAAAKYFRELNRNQKFQTVIRLYEKYEEIYRTNQDYKMQDKVREQYAYAQTNLDGLTSISKKL